MMTSDDIAKLLTHATKMADAVDGWSNLRGGNSDISRLGVKLLAAAGVGISATIRELIAALEESQTEPIADDDIDEAVEVMDDESMAVKINKILCDTLISDDRNVVGLDDAIKAILLLIADVRKQAKNDAADIVVGLFEATPANQHRRIAYLIAEHAIRRGRTPTMDEQFNLAKNISNFTGFCA